MVMPGHLAMLFFCPQAMTIYSTLSKPRQKSLSPSSSALSSLSGFFFSRLSVQFPIIYFTVVGKCFALYASRCQLMELSPPRMDRSVVMVTFINHTSCECLSKRPLHSIIRRAATDHLCSPPDLPCASGSFWDPVNCVCVSTDTVNYSDRETEVLDSGLLALCGPNRVLEDSTCECVCQNGLTEDSCDPGWKLDHNTCECQCEGPADGKFCPAGQRWDDDLCGCVCAADCPGNQPLNPDTCLCQCRETPESCLRQGKRFNRNTCSCYRLPCRKPRRVCQTGFYYSHQVCQCIPNHMRPEWN